MKNIINITKKILFIHLIILLIILLATYQPVFAFMLNIKEISKLSYDDTLNEFLIKKHINDSLLIINIASEYNLFFKKFSYVAVNGPTLNIEYQFDTIDLINLYEFINFINLNSKYENIKISYLNISINKKSNSYNKTNNILYKLTIGLEYKLVQNSSGNFSVPIVIVLEFIKDCFKKFDVDSLFFNENFKYLAINGYFSLKGTKKMLLNNIVNFKENIDHFEINEKQYTTIPDQVLIPFSLKIYFKN